MTSPRTKRGLAALGSALGLVLLAPQAPTSAATFTVVADGHSFSPSSVTLAMSDTVTWSFKSLHSSTSKQGFWTSGTQSSGTYSRAFPDAGSFGYYCTVHGMTMSGTVKVKMRSFGTPANGYAIRWSTRTSTPAGLRYDVQVKPPGATSWVNYRENTTTRTATFNPTRAGTYYLRVRTENIGVGSSNYSLLLTLKIT